MNISFKKQHTAWFEDIPQIWDVKKVKEVYKFVSVKVSDIDYPALTVSSKLGITPQMENVAKTLNGDARKRVEVGDFVINSRADRPGACGISNFEGSVSMICHVLKPRKLDILDPTYMHYLFRNNMFSQEFFRWGRGIVSDLWSTRKDDFGNIQIPLPDLNTQKIIGNYLSKKDNSIQKLLDLKNEQLSKLEQQRQSIITEAVTKGLNPNVKMKDSGVEWIGEIPEHWDMTKIKFVLSNLDYKRIPLSSEERGKMSSKVYDYYGASGVIDKVDDYLFDEPTIIVGEDGANLYSRSSPLAFLATGKYWVNNHAHILKPLNGDLNYFVNLLEAIDYTIYITGSAQPKLTQDALGNIIIPLPPPDAQKIIGDFVVNVLGEFNELTNKLKKQIEKLKEYRQSLIYEAVTGKIDVREIELEEVR